MAYRIAFFGTASFSVPLLEGLVRDPRFEVVALVTQPDRPAGRKGTLTPPATKVAAQALQIPVYQFESVKTQDALQRIKSLQADVFAVASFGQIMPQQLLDMAPRGAINFHWSLLPRYRGASPIQGALLQGDAVTGATIMLMDAKMDHGAILSAFEEPISDQDTADTLYHRLGQKGSSLFPQVIADYLEGRITPREQDHDQATFVKLLCRDDGRLDPHLSAVDLERRVRAYQPWPGTYLEFQGKRLKVLRAQLGPQTPLSPSTPFRHHLLPAIACKDHTSLLLLEVQPEGKGPMRGEDFLRGRSDWQ